MAAPSPRLGVDHVTVVPANLDPDRDDAAESADSETATADAGNADPDGPTEPAAGAADR